MDIQISKESGVPIHLQLERQIAFLIATGKLEPGVYLPSVRALAIRLNIHHNTVSQAYQSLVDRCLIERHRGSRMMVLSQSTQINTENVKDFDDLISIAIRIAKKKGYTLQQLDQQIRKRLMAQPPDHLLIVGDEPELRQLILAELRRVLSCQIESCTPEEISSNRSLILGSLVTGIAGIMKKISPLIPRNHPTCFLKLGTADRHIALVKERREPSLIAVVSISRFFLKTAKGLLAAAIGSRHSFQQYLLPSEKPGSLQPFNLVFCDSISYHKIKGPNIIRYDLISQESIEELKNTMKLYASSGSQ